jgi:hypothetical protein
VRPLRAGGIVGTDHAMPLHHHLHPFLLGDLDGLPPVAHQGERPRARALPQPLELACGRRHAPRRAAARAKARLLQAARRRPVDEAVQRWVRVA